MGKLRTFLSNIKVYVIAFFSLVGFVLIYGWRKQAEGKALGKAEQAHDDAKEKHDAELAKVDQQVESGDAEGLKDDLLRWRNE
jgi:membrane-associated protease RseP (regulator of RpoE activity)